jgi:hypothetical protein
LVFLLLVPVSMAVSLADAVGAAEVEEEAWGIG